MWITLYPYNCLDATRENSLAPVFRGPSPKILKGLYGTGDGEEGEGAISMKNT